MAQKMTMTLVDDLDGEPIEDGQGETVRFSVDGRNYEIDLSRDNAKSFHKAIEPYLSAARQSSARRTPRTSPTSRNDPSRSSGSSSDKQELAEARSWLRGQGHQVGDRGRIPAQLLDLYRSSK